ncbi:MAG: hypothetical protein K1X33_09485 [Methanobacteriaceae archaeon]|nr:hypothetical protein [Methanobacteriaceae archaeon]
MTKIEFETATKNDSIKLNNLEEFYYDNLIPESIVNAVKYMDDEREKKEILSELSKIVSLKISQEKEQLESWFTSGIINTSNGGVLKISKLIKKSEELIKVSNKIKEKKIEKKNDKVSSLYDKKKMISEELKNIIKTISMEISTQ